MSETAQNILRRTVARTPAESGYKDHAFVLLGGCIGNTLEWFDFLLYGALSGVIFPHVFFPDYSPVAALLASFATFGVGLLARPLGAAYFARLTDKIGRKPTMVITLTIMGLGSLAIACLPGYEIIGVAAPVLLVTFRFVQGFALGGEASSAMILALEYAPDKRRGLYGAMVNMGNPGGQILVSSFVVLVGMFAGNEVLRDWAWRLPFFAGAVMAVVGYLIRRHIDESPAFVEAQKLEAQFSSPLKEVFKTQWRAIIRTAAIWAPNTACNFIVSTYSLSYMVNVLRIPTSTVFGLLFLLNVIGIALVPLGGCLSDRFGRKKVVAACLMTSMLGFLVFFPLLDTKNMALVFLAMSLTQGAQLVAVGVLAAIFAELFPVSVRYSGHAAIYTLNNLVAGAPAPFVAAGLLALTGTSWSLIGLLVAMYLLSLFLLTQSPETRWLPFRTNYSMVIGGKE